MTSKVFGIKQCKMSKTTEQQKVNEIIETYLIESTNLNKQLLDILELYKECNVITEGQYISLNSQFEELNKLAENIKP